MHIDSLGESPETPYTATPRRPVVPPQNLGHQQAGYRMAMAHLQQLYAATDQGGQPPAVAPLYQNGQGQAGAGRFPAPNQNAAVRYPDARQKKLAIRQFDGKVRWTGVRVLEVRPQVRAASKHRAVGVRLRVAQRCQGGVARILHVWHSRKEYNKQVEAWWVQLPTLQYVMERMLQAFKTNITPAQAMKLLTAPKELKRTWSEHYIYSVIIAEACDGSADYLVLNNIMQYTSADLCTVLMAKVANMRNDCLQQAEELVHFAQAWELEPVRHRNLGKEVVAAVGERHSKTRRCHEQNQVGHLRAVKADGMWIFDSGLSRHL
ncbi:hypothetical protein PI124_g1677 [Phytophthora idaei]|nr:hypothetical protein PI125_g1545 [Phytophthora idaei]KAG3173041.1 hypothetical protein PI126_g1062 [Phytophthora idaei]KAG3253761.1 hypothetical protein PI124_g1677 [Phytophthora idaei]